MTGLNLAFSYARVFMAALMVSARARARAAIFQVLPLFCLLNLFYWLYQKRFCK